MRASIFDKIISFRQPAARYTKKNMLTDLDTECADLFVLFEEFALLHSFVL